MPRVGFEPTISAGEPPKTYALDRAATGTGTIARLCALFKAHSGERVWKATRDRLRWPYCLSRVDHVLKVRDIE